MKVGDDIAAASDDDILLYLNTPMNVVIDPGLRRGQRVARLKRSEEEFFFSRDVYDEAVRRNLIPDKSNGGSDGSTQ